MNREVVPPRVVVVFGTRPEAIKLAPIIAMLRQESWCDVRTVATGQHREMLQQVLDVFAITPDYHLDVMTPGQSLAGLTGRLVPALDDIVTEEAPAALIVQGDTTTALAGALAGFYRGVPVAHVEAGLRSHDRRAPFPEEINRRLISVLASWHFAPTAQSQMALLAEGIPGGDVLITGNPVIDAVYYAAMQVPPLELPIAPIANRRLVLVTAHRRESFGAPFEALCRALRRIAETHLDVEMCFPVHLNPQVRRPVGQYLANHPRIHLLDPLDYLTFVHLLKKSYLVITDSGGLQEEAPALGKPVLVLRDVTERPEAIAAGTVRLVGTDEARIVAEAGRLLSDATEYARMARVVTPYGDGRASERIVSFLRDRLAEGDQFRGDQMAQSGTLATHVV